ncbi:glycine zipper domain-containing protein [Rhodopirellula sp. JC740]|uniref:Glycine zipper domain-containing protein n=1 Tax=Rhodopirellula halodulae TaxID=2894198 RepID=A0ABS8NCV6_9BACT|nr:glycine zipper domain-containing protein [Rhodopirellula sp. JC740]MCC9641382.1 glycine zipper domain-containing protein [Rhodopirellula sp. JC740]
MNYQPKFGCRVVAVGAALVASALFTPQTASAQANTQRGATLGGITGAIAGAIIGDNNNEAGAGAAIGGAVGAVAGGLLGNAKDKELQAQRQYYGQPGYAQPATTYPAAPVNSGAVSFNDVVAMCRSGVSESVVLNQIASRGVQRRPVVSDIISLHQQGVSEVVISAMQNAPVGDQVVVSQPTVVETPVYVPAPRVHVYPAPVYRSRPVYHAPPRYGRGSGFHFHYGH